MFSLVEKAIIIKKIYIFDGLSLEELKLVAEVCEEVFYNKDEVVIREGDCSDALFLILSGSVNIVKGQNTSKKFILNTLEKGDYFGEMSMFDGEPHSATVVTLEDSHFLLIRKEHLFDIIDIVPEIAFGIIKVLSQRLRAADKKMAQMSHDVKKM